MKRPDYTSGEVFYRVTYPDRALCYPGIESFVFIGMNLSDENEDDTWYFQPAASYAKFGSVVATKSGDRKVCAVSERELNEMLDVPGLEAELSGAVDRRNRLR